MISNKRLIKTCIVSALRIGECPLYSPHISDSERGHMTQPGIQGAVLTSNRYPSPLCRQPARAI